VQAYEIQRRLRVWRPKRAAVIPGWLGQLFTHRVRGLENFGELFEILGRGTGVIKVFCEVAEDADQGERAATPAAAMEAVMAA
jgi:hypothetical protein